MTRGERKALTSIDDILEGLLLSVGKLDVA
jgi:hypothetical protein